MFSALSATTSSPSVFAITKYERAAVPCGIVSCVWPALTPPGKSTGTARPPVSGVSDASHDPFSDRKNRVVDAAALPPPSFRTVSVTVNVPPAATVDGDGRLSVTLRSGPIFVDFARVLFDSCDSSTWLGPLRWPDVRVDSALLRKVGVIDRGFSYDLDQPAHPTRGRTACCLMCAQTVEATTTVWSLARTTREQLLGQHSYPPITDKETP